MTDCEILLWESRMVNIRWKQKADALLEGEHLSAAPAYLLWRLLRHGDGGSFISSLCQVSGLASPTLSRMVKRLQEDGYVRMDACPGDGRRKLLVCTEKARRLQPFLEDRFRQMQAALYRDFSRQELDQLDRLQKKMLRNLSADDTKPSHKEESKT